MKIRLLLMLVCVCMQTKAQIIIVFEEAESFGVLGSSTVTSTGGTVINGDLGVSPGTAITGFPPGIVNGTIHAADAIAGAARADALLAYDLLAGEAVDANLTGSDLGGLTLFPGVYHFDTSAGLTGGLTLDGGGDPNARFHFQIGSTLTTAAASGVSLLNGARAENIFWQVGSSATLGTLTDFAGSILANASITMITQAELRGRAFALNGAVTMDNNLITAVPEPIGTTMLVAGLLVVFLGIRRGFGKKKLSDDRRVKGSVLDIDN